MQIFIRSLSGGSRALDVTDGTSIIELKHLIQELEGVPIEEQRLVVGCQALDCDESQIGPCGLQAASTVQLLLRLRGGKPIKVDIITDHLPCGREVWIDIEADTPMHEVKRKLASATGVPVASQKVMLSGIGQMVMGDKRTNVGFSHCGSTDSFYFATVGDQKTANVIQTPSAPSGSK